MIKATAHRVDGRTLLVIGLSFANLDKFRRAPGDTYIRIDGNELGLSIDVVIFSGETEEAMAVQMINADLIDPETGITVSERKKH